MNKKLVALAVAGACALPVAVQAQTANVTLYGRVHLDMEVVHGRQANGSNPHVFRVSSNSSRFGIRGTESLGGGLNAIFQLESSVVADAGGGTIAGRESFVGLQGSWGTFKMGNFLVPYDDLAPIFMNPHQYGSSLFATGALWGASSGYAGSPVQATCGDRAFDCRAPNSVRYDTPNIAGFTGSYQYATREGTPIQHSGLQSAGVFYNNGPIWAGTAYSYNEDIGGPGLDDRAWSIAASYNFGIVRPAVVYETAKWQTPVGSVKRNFWGVSALVPIGGASSIYGFYGHAGNTTGSAPDGTRIGGSAGAAPVIGVVKGPDTGANHWVLSYGYALSKRTNVYAAYTKVDNKCKAAYSTHINPITIAPPTATTCSGKPDAFGVGVVHNF